MSDAPPTETLRAMMKRWDEIDTIWNDDGFVDDVIHSWEALAEEVIAHRTGEMGQYYVDLQRRFDAAQAELAALRPKPPPMAVRHHLIGTGKPCWCGEQHEEAET